MALTLRREPKRWREVTSRVTLSLLLLIVGTASASAQTGNGDPLKYIASCELDFNNDGQTDIALLVETVRGRELIILLKTKDAYTAYEVANVPPLMHLSCRFGRALKETAAGRQGTEAKVHRTPGTYIRLNQPEGASMAYFWNGTGFTRVWTSD